MNMTTFLPHVLVVENAVPDEEVIGINASRDVALVENAVVGG